MLADVSRTFKPINGQKVDAELNSRLRVSDRGAFVQHDTVVFFDVLDDGAGGVAGRLDDADAFFDGDAGVGTVVGGVHGGEEGDVDAKGVRGHVLGLADFFAKVFGCRLG